VFPVATCPLVGLFLYYLDDNYLDDTLTRVHHALLCQSNPSVPIIPLTDGGPPYLPGTLDVAGLPWQWGPDRNPWRNVDTFAYRAFAAGLLPEAQRYALIEHDVLVTMPLADYFAAVWDADLAGSVIATPATQPHWQWWSALAGYPDLWPHRTGIVPSGVVLFSRRALALLAASHLACFAELRIGTLAKHAGLNLAEVPEGWRTVGSVAANVPPIEGPGVYHPVKKISGDQRMGFSDPEQRPLTTTAGVPAMVSSLGPFGVQGVPDPIRVAAVLVGSAVVMRPLQVAEGTGEVRHVAERGQMPRTAARLAPPALAIEPNHPRNAVGRENSRGHRASIACSGSRGVGRWIGLWPFAGRRSRRVCLNRRQPGLHWSPCPSPARPSLRRGLRGLAIERASRSG
jgi:hypothetical protein